MYDKVGDKVLESFAESYLWAVKEAFSLNETNIDELMVEAMQEYDMKEEEFLIDCLLDRFYDEYEVTVVKKT